MSLDAINMRSLSLHVDLEQRQVASKRRSNLVVFTQSESKSINFKSDFSSNQRSQCKLLYNDTIRALIIQVVPKNSRSTLTRSGYNFANYWSSNIPKTRHEAEFIRKLESCNLIILRSTHTE